MNTRLLPLAPPYMPSAGPMLRLGLPRLTLVSMPWMELGLFAVMIVAVVRLGG